MSKKYSTTKTLLIVVILGGALVYCNRQCGKHTHVTTIDSVQLALVIPKDSFSTDTLIMQTQLRRAMPELTEEFAKYNSTFFAAYLKKNYKFIDNTLKKE
jgi:hypothetical protein